MTIVRAAILIHVAMGAIWLLATCCVAITGRARPIWLRLTLGAAAIAMLAGIYLWHALHAGPWGTTERLLVVGTFASFVALGMQTPIVLGASRDIRRLEGPVLAVFRVTALLVAAAATAMLASRS